VGWIASRAPMERRRGGHDDGADVGVKVAQGRNARSEPLLVAGMSWFVMKTKP
jgi:hypothetical protein